MRDRFRVLGPYRDRHQERWVYEVRYPDGRRDRRRCRRGCTRAAAIAEVAALRARLEADAAAVRTVADAVSAYIHHLTGLEHAVPAWTRHALSRLCSRHGDVPVGQVTGQHLLDVLHAMRDLALDTQRSYWRALRRACRWWLQRGFVMARIDEAAENLLARDERVLPWQTIRAARRLCGKPQLTEAELREYVETALQRPHPRDVCAAILPALTGMDSTELRHLQVGDVDFAAGAIWARRGLKRRDRRRTFPIPAPVRSHLQELVARRRRDEVLFADCNGRPRTRWWLLDVVVRTARDAGVPRVTPHGLRGTYATILAERGRRRLADVALVLGHADQGQTADRHYVRGVERREELTLQEDPCK